MKLTTAISCLSCVSTVLAQTWVTSLVTGAYDGDTLTVEAGIWPDLTWDGSVRILGVDTQEIRGACEVERQLAIAARDYIRDLLLDESVILANVENDKYGERVLANVYFWQDDELARVSDLLIANGHAREYHGGTRRGGAAGRRKAPTRRMRCSASPILRTAQATMRKTTIRIIRHPVRRQRQRAYLMR